MRLPTYDQSPVEPNTLPTPHMSGAAPIAQATERLGHNIGSGELFEVARHIQARADASVVMDAYVNFSKQAMALQTDAYSKKGKDALNYDPYVSQFNDAYAETKGRLSPNQQFIFDQKVAHERINFETGLVRHAHEQGDWLNKENAKAVVGIEEQKLSTLANDENGWQEQFKQFKASNADLLNVHGITDGDPAFKQGMDNAASKAIVDRVKILATSDRGDEALKFFHEHENEIDVKDREVLSQHLGNMTDSQEAFKISMGFLNDLRHGTKVTDIEERIYPSLQNKPKVYKAVQTELRTLAAQVNQDQAGEVVSRGAALETMIANAQAKGQIFSSGSLMSTPEFKEIQKEALSGNKHAQQYMHKILQERAGEEKGIKTEASKAKREREHDVRENRIASKQEQLLNRQMLDLKLGDPQYLEKHTKQQIYDDVVAAGGDMNSVKRAWSEKATVEKKPKTPEMNYQLDLKENIVDDIFKRANIDPAEKEGFRTAFGAALNRAEKLKGSPLTDQEIVEGGLRGVQYYAKTFMGIKTGHGWIDKGAETPTSAGKSAGEGRPPGGYGKREDGTEKGNGFLGPLPMTDGSKRIASEISVGVQINGKETLIPTLTPNQSKKEVDHLLAGGRPTKGIIDKAVEHAKQRIAQGKSPFASEVEQQSSKVPPGAQLVPNKVTKTGKPVYRLSDGQYWTP